MVLKHDTALLTNQYKLEIRVKTKKRRSYKPHVLVQRAAYMQTDIFVSTGFMRCNYIHTRVYVTA